eukprot:jgi/Tetstr1/426562/TSEL_001638.t1
MAFQQVAAMRGSLARAPVPCARGLTSLIARPAPHYLAAPSPLRRSPAAPLRRSFAASAEASSNLKKILQEELKEEKDNAPAEPEALKKVPAGFKVEKDVPGDGQIVLVKTVDGAEVAITFEVNDQPDPEDVIPMEDEEGGEEEEGSAVDNFFVVSVTKGDKMMTFECETDGNEMLIKHMTLEPKDGVDSDSSAYTGPVFWELDDRVQERAFEYLESLGITDCCEYVSAKIDAKEQELYVEWLDGSVKFLSS